MHTHTCTRFLSSSANLESTLTSESLNQLELAAECYKQAGRSDKDDVIKQLQRQIDKAEVLCVCVCIIRTLAYIVGLFCHMNRSLLVRSHT